MVIRSARIRLLTVDCHPFRGCHVILKGKCFTCVVASCLLHTYLEITYTWNFQVTLVACHLCHNLI